MAIGWLPTCIFDIQKLAHTKKKNASRLTGHVTCHAKNTMSIDPLEIEVTCTTRHLKYYQL